MDGAQVHVKLPRGGAVSIGVAGARTAGELKARAVQAAKDRGLADLAPSTCRLVFAGRQLEDQRTLRDYNFIEESEFHVQLRVLSKTDQLCAALREKNRLGDCKNDSSAPPAHCAGVPKSPDTLSNTSLCL
jgi:hypothetical protein